MNLFEKQAKLNELFRQSPVSTAYLTGSLVSRATFGQLTDVDIAILLLEQIRADNFFDYQMYFLNELSKRLETDAVNVVILNQASMLLKLQAIKYGQILFSRDEKRRIAFESKAILDYLDFKRFEDVHTQALSGRIHPQGQAVNPELVLPLLGQLERSITALGEHHELGFESLVEDRATRAAIERHLLLAIEQVLHICTVLVAALELRKPDGYQDLLSTVAGSQVISKNLAYRLEVLLDLRDSLLASDSTATAALHDALVHRVTDLEEFARAIIRFTDGQ